MHKKSILFQFNYSLLVSCLFMLPVNMKAQLSTELSTNILRFYDGTSRKAYLWYNTSDDLILANNASSGSRDIVIHAKRNINFQTPNIGSQRMTITNQGLVGIGTTVPSEMLHLERSGSLGVLINASDNFDSSLKLFEGNGFGFEFKYNGGTDLLELWSRGFSGNEGLRVSWNKTGDMDVRGRIFQNGSLIHSDKRYKKQIKKIDNSLTRLQRINGVSYTFNQQQFADRNFSKKRTMGSLPKK